MKCHSCHNFIESFQTQTVNGHVEFYCDKCWPSRTFPIQQELDLIKARLKILENEMHLLKKCEVLK